MGCLRLANTENFEPVLRVEHSKNRGTESPQLDARLGRWMSVDPVFLPHQSPYCSMDGNPISFNDPMGACTDGTCPKENDTRNNGDGTHSIYSDGEWNTHPSYIILRYVDAYLSSDDVSGHTDDTFQDWYQSEYATDFEWGDPGTWTDPGFNADDFAAWIRDLESNFGSVMVYGEGKSKGDLIGSDRGGATDSFDAKEFEEMMSGITDLLRDKEGTGLIASQKEMLETLRNNLKDDLIEMVEVDGLVVTDKQKANLIVQAMVQAGDILDVITDEQAKRMSAQAQAHFLPKKKEVTVHWNDLYKTNDIQFHKEDSSISISKKDTMGILIRKTGHRDTIPAGGRIQLNKNKNAPTITF